MSTGTTGKKMAEFRYFLWAADCLGDAEEIEADYIARGMKGGTGGDLSPDQPVCEYVF
jgi:hypothetical protein